MSDALYNEKDRHCAGWLRNLVATGLIAPGCVDDRDVRDVLPSDLDGHRQVHLFAGAGLWSHALRLAGWSDDRPVWTISCPCQPFSQAGGGAGVFDDRHLWPAAHWLVAQQRPCTIFGEQVASADGLAWFDIVSADLEALGYACGPLDFPSAGVGAPNIRQRLYWVADTTGAVRHWGERDSDPAGLPGSANGGRLGHAESRGCGEHGLLGEATRCGEAAGQPAFTDQDAGRLGDAGDARLPNAEPSSLCGSGRWGEGGATEQSGRAFHPWSEPEWVECIDTDNTGQRRWRPFESGAFPLAPRHPGDVAKLRAYGNAINPIVAAEVIRAWMVLAA